jgi:Tfp pilus assembly protein PilN
MLNPEEIERLIDQKIDQRIESLTEEIAALKGQLGKVDLLTIDTRNMRQTLERMEVTQENARLNFERQDKRIVRFERQTNDQLTGLQKQITDLDNRLDEKIIGMQTEVRQQFAIVDQQFTRVDQQFAEHRTLLTEILARLPEKQA